MKISLAQQIEEVDYATHEAAIRQGTAGEKT